MGLHCTKNQHDAIRTIIDRLTKSSHFLAMKMIDALVKLSRLYIQEIIRLHGIPLVIISDRGPRFVLGFWESLQSAMVW